MEKKYACPLCGGNDNEALFNWENMPINGNAIFESKTWAEACICEDLQMNFCKKCGFVFNPEFDNKYDDELYSRKYSVNRSQSKVYLDYLNETIDFIMDYVEKLDTVVDVGCGDEHFLLNLKKQASLTRAIGYDPSLKKTELIQGIHLVKDFYGEKYLNDNADLITCRQVIEHISNPYIILNTIAQAGKQKKTYLYIETPDIEYILQNNIFDFYYEHCSYYSKDSLTYLLNKCGFRVVAFDNKFGGQYLNCIAVSDDSCVTDEIPQHLNIYDFSLNIKKVHYKIESFLKKVKSDGKHIYAWGGSAKGTTYANLFDKEQVYFDYFVDINPLKHNTYIPKTAHQIIGITEVMQRKPDIVLLTNGIYKKDVDEMLDGCNCELICVEDFNNL